MAEDVLQGGADTIHNLPPYRTNIFPGYRDFSTSSEVSFNSSINDSQLGDYVGVRKMAASLRTGSAMLSRIATPSTCLARRTFTTSLAFRTGPKITTEEESSPAVNPLARSDPFVSDPSAEARSEAVGEAAPETRPNPLIGSFPPAPPRNVPETAESKTSNHTYDATKPYTLDIAQIIANKASAFGNEQASDPIARPQIRAKPVTGRTVFVKEFITKTSGPTPMMALKILNRIVREDQVKNKYHSQKFHERKGLKRKRLASQRWRARFKHGFKATVSRVMELKKQGW
ncbi:hypothetical protein FPSE5266_05783 [Fusarium pseudograminearum]|nr:hypothetical protein FPSE5266_05783 [Fusarium pseudograminearum]